MQAVPFPVWCCACLCVTDAVRVGTHCSASCRCLISLSAATQIPAELHRIKARVAFAASWVGLSTGCR